MGNGETAPSCSCTQCGRFLIQDQADFSVVKDVDSCVMKCDVCIRKDLNADVVLSGDTDISFTECHEV